MKDSSLGPNGSSRNFFKKFLPNITEFFLKLINNMDNHAPKQFKTSYIKLIPKISNKNINDYRPTTVTNYEYRIFAKIDDITLGQDKGLHT
jgi:hypothetical protein